MPHLLQTKTKKYSSSDGCVIVPKVRVIPARLFLSTGIDCGGPVTLKIHNMHSIRDIKAYICIFICMVTKAVHIEVVTDLTTEAFLAALTRFVSRRGLCTDLYSDFPFNKILFQPSCRSPSRWHLGKRHQKREASPQACHRNPHSNFVTIHDTRQVEAMLNSRPLTSLSNDPNDLNPLTPGHFLIGSPLAAIPEEGLLETPSNRLKHWQLVQALQQRIWKRWNREYLQTLQQRLKWSSPSQNLRPGDLVLVHQDTPPLTWPLARITDVTTGQDGMVRVVRLKTQNMTLCRPAVKISNLKQSMLPLCKYF